MTAFVRNIFSDAEVPPTYELLNHILTFGFDTLWRKRAAKIAATAGGADWADMCTGTGEMAVYLRRLASSKTRVYGIDFSLPMMAEATRKSEAGNIHFLASDIRALPFPAESFDLVTMSFATRNNNLSRDVLIQTFAELYRVLKPGGQFINLETSKPPLSVVRRCFHWYVRLFVERVGTRVSGSRTGYVYLSQTIRSFYSAEELVEIIREAGFETVTFDRLLLGVAAIHRAIKGNG